MKEIKATAATWEDIKRLSEENERLKREVDILSDIIDRYKLRESVRKMINNNYIGEQNK